MTSDFNSWHTHLGLLENTMKTENVVRSALFVEIRFPSGVGL